MSNNGRDYVTTVKVCLSCMWTCKTVFKGRGQNGFNSLVMAILTVVT